MEDNKDLKVFAFIVDGDVFHTMTVPGEASMIKLIAGLQSDPKVIDVSHMPDIKYQSGWKYNYESEEFYREQQPQPHQPQHIAPEDDYEVE